LGTDAYEDGDTIAAIKTFKSILNTYENEYDALNYLAEIYFYKKEFDSSYFYTREMLRIRPELGESYLYYSLLCIFIDKLDEAYQSAKTGYELDTLDQSDYWRKLSLAFQAHALLFKGEGDKAREIYNTMTEVDEIEMLESNLGLFEESGLKQEYLDLLREVIEEQSKSNIEK
jgi:tetratricopeptide (TPR) repeat protein